MHSICQDDLNPLGSTYFQPRREFSSGLGSHSRRSSSISLWWLLRRSTLKVAWLTRLITSSSTLTSAVLASGASVSSMNRLENYPEPMPDQVVNNKALTDPAQPQ